MSDELELENEELKARVERLENTQDLLFAFIFAMQNLDGNKVDAVKILSKKTVEKLNEKIENAGRLNTFEKTKELKERHKQVLNKVKGGF